MLNGITITVVGMLTVFVFLAILVLAMWLLKVLVTRLLSRDDSPGNLETIAVAVAAAVDAEKRAGTR